MVPLNRFNKLCWTGLNLNEFCLKQLVSLCCRRNIAVCTQVQQFSPLAELGTGSRAVTTKLRTCAPYAFSVLMIRHNSNESKNIGKITSTDEEVDDSDYESNDVEERLHDIDEDYDAPLNFREMKIHSLRADHVVAKGLGLSKSSIEGKFYQSKLLLNGKTLLKKAKQIMAGDCIDLIVEENENKLSVQRVKISEISDQLTKKGNPIVEVRVWRKPFEIDSSS